MQILEILRDGQPGAAPASLADAFGLEPSAADIVTGNLVDELAYALERNTLSRGGVSDLLGIVGHGGYSQYAEKNADLSSSETKQAGDALLRKILGSKHDSRGVAARVARKSDVAPGVVERVLPVVAAMMMGEIEKQADSELQDVAQRFAGDRVALAPQQPLPVPGDNIDYGGRRRSRSGGNSFDDLSDMIRRGGYSIPGGGRGHGGVKGATLSQIVRQIFGNLLGFQSKGIVSWIVRVIVLRYGWRIVTSILRRIFLGR